MSKKCAPLWREAHVQVKMHKTRQLRTTFGSWDVEKVHAVVARSTFPRQNGKNTTCSDHFLTCRGRKSARRCDAKHISKSKVSKTEGVRATFWRSDVDHHHHHHHHHNHNNNNNNNYYYYYYHYYYYYYYYCYCCNYNYNYNNYNYYNHYNNYNNDSYTTPTTTNNYNYNFTTATTTTTIYTTLNDSTLTTTTTTTPLLYTTRLHYITLPYIT